LLVGAVGDLTEGIGKFKGLQATFVFNGEITPALGFQGNITCRVEDPDGKLRTEREISGLSHTVDEDETDTDVACILMRGEKKHRTVRTEYGPPPGGKLVTLVTPAQMRAAQFAFSNNEHESLRCRMKVGQIVAHLLAKVTLDIFAPPGTAAAPNFFITRNLYTFCDPTGREVGSITADLVFGKSFALQFPDAPGQRGMRFGGFGLIVESTGIFSGVQGLVSDNSAIGVAPHALSLLNMVRIFDPEGRFRNVSRAAHETERKEVQGKMCGGDPFLDLVRRKDAHSTTYLKWRRAFQRCAGGLAISIADAFNRRINFGEFQGLNIVPDALEKAFGKEVGPYDGDTFNRYEGPAKGVFRTYNKDTEKQIDVSTLYSYWGKTVHIGSRRYAKKITGSYFGYFDPEHLPDLRENKVDLLVNSYRAEDVGLTSWVSIYQGGKRERTSFGYKLPHNYEVLWIVKDISHAGETIENDVFMASHEWKETFLNKELWYMVGIFFKVNFDTCTATETGDVFWKALYEPE
jgi:hypothetical protein